MAKAIVIYYSKSGNTKKMAEIVAEAINIEGAEAELKDIKDVALEELPNYEAILIGSPTYYGSMSNQIKKLLDDSVKFHGKLDGKIGAAFSSSVNIGGGNETTILDILNAMLIHGMIIQGDPQGDHYGAVSIGTPDARARKQCLRLGSRVANLMRKIEGAKS